MLQEMPVMSSGGGGGNTILIAYAVNYNQAFPPVGHNTDHDTDYVDISADSLTLTFKKSCSGYITWNALNWDSSSTATITPVTLDTPIYYFGGIAYFEANAGETLVITGESWNGYYAIIGS